jgi:ribose transport system substrate-binding protein
MFNPVRRNFYRPFAVSVTGVALVALALTGCAATSSPSAKTAKSVVYVQGISGNAFFTSVTCGAQAEAKAEGVTFSFQGGADYSPQSQTPILNAVIAKHPDGIIISPMAGVAMVPPLSQAKQASIKVVFVDSTAADSSLAQSFVSSDNRAGGALAAQKVVAELGGKGTVMVMGATPGISTITLLPTQFSGSTPATATAKLSAVIAAHPELNAVFAVSTQEVEGVAVAVKTAGLSGKLGIIGFDTSDPILADVQSGLVTGLVVQEPLSMGKIAMQQMVKSMNGQSTTPVVNTPFVYLTKDNMSDPSINQFIYKTSC